MHTLFLTPVEQTLFSAVNSTASDGWDTQTEELTFADSPAKFQLRLELLRLHDPALIALRHRVKTMTNPAELEEEFKKIAPELLLHEDLAAIFFALGSGILSELIGSLLPSAANDTDLLRIAALSFVRHEILLSYHPVS